MTGTGRRDLRARGHLARLVAMLAVLAGLVALLAPRCTDGMIAETPTAHASTMGMAAHSETGGDVHQTARGTADGVPVQAEPAGAGSRGMGGVLAACLALLVMVAVGVAALARPERSRVATSSATGVRALMARGGPARTAGLDRLCVLRI